ncbi:hypothetical protein ADZ36_07220 [Streptomyces fradiae]|uniref:PDGLE domain-containing protein n=2 Tax=Streptomyces TaxID=1883 RepID=A0A3M8EVJ2_9ACTN|nr:hypothetical protein ADZ36_07220 [Streptomyces fradiae]OFA48449.1 hypothetical protein BEN35_18615 [Streptomyces fradiae]PQM20110.1 hypothetical protein Sfr7A_28535 [Streptomyces xinghaiensis]RKM96035.1 hypothetical protein SFRA_013710 [Streptomyces xinghaiensis]RNC69990.1 hypothetical protein DC095_027595 [Streptomyces xinghaiensis]
MSATRPRGPRTRLLWITGVLTALLLAGVVSYYASASPDGLEKVAADHGIDRKTEEHAAKDSPLADYQARDIVDPRLSGGLAGVVGVGATLALGTGLFWLVRRRPQDGRGEDAAQQDAAPQGAPEQDTGAEGSPEAEASGEAAPAADGTGTATRTTTGTAPGTERAATARGER